MVAAVPLPLIVQDWKAVARQSLSIRQIRPAEEMNALRQWCSRYQGAESYTASPAIMCLYGRHGLWAYHDQSATLIFYRDPDKPGIFSILPQIGDQSRLLAHDIMSIMPKNMKFELVRVPAAESIALAQHFSTVTGKPFRVIEETARDYHFPVQILDIQALAELNGGVFKTVRKRIQRLNRNHNIEISSYEPDRDNVALKRVYRNWAKARHLVTAPCDVVNDFTQSLIELAANPEARIKGLCVRMNGVAAGFSLWEQPLVGSRQANGLTTICNPEITGMPELLIFETACALHKARIKTLNIGGSETAGLDAFKRKFRPVQSIPLCTIGLKPG